MCHPRNIEVSTNCNRWFRSNNGNRLQVHYNCYWKGSSHPFIKYIASKSQLPRQVVPRCIRTLGSFVHALQSYKAFDLACRPDGPQNHHVVITAKLRNKRKVTVYYFKVEPTSCINTLKKVIEAEEGRNAIISNGFLVSLGRRQAQVHLMQRKSGRTSR